MTAADRDAGEARGLHSASPVARARALAQLPAVRQFLKFCTVGASSTAIDVLLLYTLVHYTSLSDWVGTTLGPYPSLLSIAQRLHLDALIAQAISWAVAVTNGFFWNSRWTFAGFSNPARRRRQYVQYLLVNAVGLVLDFIIISATYGLFSRIVGRKLGLLGSKAGAIGIVVFWNFLANRYWTFRESLTE